MKKTRLSGLLGIRYPILQGGMLWLADAGLAAAVSNAGGLGVVSPMAGMEPHGDPVENLTVQLGRVKELTQAPYGVNVPLDLRDCGLIMDLLVSFEAPVVVTAAGDPRLYTELLQSGGVKVLHVVGSVKHARVAEAAGVDGIVAVGIEAAARNGFDEVPLFSLVPQVVDAVGVPVVAAGGIADGRGLAAALALGAAGVQMGTRFVAVKECIAHPAYKQAILDAGDTDTAVTNRPLIPTRSLRTPYTQILLELEAGGADGDAIREFMGHAASRRGGLEGDIEGGEAYAGSSAGLVNDIPTAAEVIQRMVAGCDAALAALCP